MAEQKRDIETYTIGLLGDLDVGKSTLLLRFTEGHFEESHIKRLGIDWKRRGNLHIWEAPAERTLRPPDKRFLLKTDGIVLMYDPFDRESFESVTSWANKAREKFPNALMILISTKSDLPEPIVSKAEGLALAVKLEVPFIQTSAKSNNSIEKAFSILENEIRSKQQALAAAEFRFKSEFDPIKPLYDKFLAEESKVLATSITHYANTYKLILNLTQKRALLLKPFEEKLIALSQSNLPDSTICDLAYFYDWKKRVQELRAIFTNDKSSPEQQQNAVQELERLQNFVSQMAKKVQEKQGGLMALVFGNRNPKLEEASEIFNDTSRQIATILSLIHFPKKVPEEKIEKEKPPLKPSSPFFSIRQGAAPPPQTPPKAPAPSQPPMAPQGRGLGGNPS